MLLTKKGSIHSHADKRCVTNITPVTLFSIHPSTILKLFVMALTLNVHIKMNTFKT